jgi:hypothetical protein
MKRSRAAPIPRAVQRALHGGGPQPAASAALRAPDDWELVVAAVELALLDGAGEAPPAHLCAKLTRLLTTMTKPSR